MKTGNALSSVPIKINDYQFSEKCDFKSVAHTKKKKIHKKEEEAFKRRYQCEV